MTPTSEILYRAADLIEERGWTRGEGWPKSDSDSAPLCLEGGIMAAAGWRFILDMHAECPAYRAVSDYLGRDYEADQLSALRGVWIWNDDIAESAAEVIATLRAAALIEAAKENTEARGLVSAS